VYVLSLLAIWKMHATGDSNKTPRTVGNRNRGIAMLLFKGVIVMRILSKKALKELVLYSPQHVARLEKAGTFPKRVMLGPNRVGWVEAEVLDWLQERIESRE
jgi:prophage regulatory protein